MDLTTKRVFHFIWRPQMSYYLESRDHASYLRGDHALISRGVPKSVGGVGSCPHITHRPGLYSYATSSS